MGIIYEFRDCTIIHENEKMPILNLTINSGEKIGIIITRDLYDFALLYFLFFINREYEGYASIKNIEFKDLHESEIIQILKTQIHVSPHLPLISNLKLIENIYLPLLYHSNLSENILFNKAYEILKQLGIESSYNKLPAYLTNHEKRCGLLARAFLSDANLVYYSHIIDDSNREYRDFYLKQIIDFHNTNKDRITIMTFRQKTHIPEDFKFDKIISLK
ncbi:MAG: hypothetical protein N2202_00120 [Proteobacteria bacterium]|nr:hypothetical protein [Pseudomonadota bacterium]